MTPMRKISRNRAGREVTEVAARLSDALLVHEQASFGRIRAGFRARIPTIRSVPQLRSDRAARTRIVDGFRAALWDAKTETEALAGRATARAWSAGKAEVLWCERALPARYRGLTGKVKVDLDRIQARRLRVWQSEVADTPAWFSQRLTYELAQARDVAELEARLFSPTPARVRGHAQVGAWWLPVSGILTATRAVSIGCGNDTVVAVMAGFNEAAGD